MGLWHLTPSPFPTVFTFGSWGTCCIDRWVKIFLNNQTQKVLIHDLISLWKLLTREASQRFVLELMLFNSSIHGLYDETDYPSVDYRGWISHQRVELQLRDCLRDHRNGFKRKEYKVFHVWGIAGLIKNWDGKVAPGWKAPGGYNGATIKLSMSQKCTFITKQLKQHIGV